MRVTSYTPPAAPSRPPQTVPSPVPGETPPPPAPDSSPPPPPPVDSPYQKLKHSKFGQLVSQHKALTGVAAVGGSIVIAGGANQSPAFANIAQYGIVPAAGAGIAALGGVVAHDAVVNDLGHGHNLRGTSKLVGGALAALGGTQLVGQAYSIPVMDQALTRPLEQVLEHGESLLGASVIAGGAAAGTLAARSFKQAVTNPEHRARNAALGVGGSVASAAGVLGGAELIGRDLQIPGLDRALTATIERLSQGGIGSVGGGALLLAGAGVLANEATGNARGGGNDFITVAEGMGGVTAALGGTQLAGHGLGLSWTQGLLTHHADSVGSVALAGLGTALTKASLENVKEQGLTPTNSFGLTAGTVMAEGGAGLAAYTFGLTQAANLVERTSEVTAGVGLAASTFALGRAAVGSFKAEEPVAGLSYAAGAAATGSASLYALGEGLHIEPLQHVAGQVVDHTLVPLYDHALEPFGRFLFNNPVAGAVTLAAGIGGYLYWRTRQGHE